MQDRINEELAILRKSYPDMEFVPDGQWVMIPAYPLPSGWNRVQTDVAFQIPPQGYPGAHPYGLYVPTGLRFGSTKPNNYTEPANNKPPFSGAWGIFSWQPEQWNPAANVTAGSNLWTWVKGFSARFREGV